MANSFGVLFIRFSFNDEECVSKGPRVMKPHYPLYKLL